MCASAVSVGFCLAVFVGYWISYSVEITHRDYSVLFLVCSCDLVDYPVSKVCPFCTEFGGNVYSYYCDSRGIMVMQVEADTSAGEVCDSANVLGEFFVDHHESASTKVAIVVPALVVSHRPVFCL